MEKPIDCRFEHKMRMRNVRGAIEEAIKLFGCNARLCHGFSTYMCMVYKGLRPTAVTMLP